MPIATHVHDATVRVRYSETDAAGIAHHSSFVNWLEVGRVEWLRVMGSSYHELERAGYSLPVVELHLRYVAPAHFDDQLVIRTALSDARSRTVSFVYEVRTVEEHPRQLANGMSRHICVRNGQVAPMPEVVRALIGRDGPATTA
jgi:acyl-CoA thioester hydrolase